VMDNSNKLVRLGVTLNADASIASATVADGVSLAQTRDFEGVAAAGAGSVFLAEEGTPAVHEYAASDGSLVRTLAVPAIFGTRRDNFGFESMTRHPFTGELWTANEEALGADGGTSTTTAGTIVRLLKYRGNPPVPEAEFAYVCQPLHGAAVSGSRSGLCDLVWLPSGRVLAMERSLALSAAGLFQTRIYEIDFAGANNVASFGGLVDQMYAPVAKRLLYQGSHNNLEGLCLGPRLANGNYALIGVVDDGDPISTNAVVSFELSGGVACIADFNDDGAISVQDIFDFLAGYFASSPRADVNGSGGLGVQDIFDFLSAYFAMCL